MRTSVSNVAANFLSPVAISEPSISRVEYSVITPVTVAVIGSVITSFPY
ncbi:Uncharacterised protein [Enterobacter cloacae]|nr:Uncharacterised protein [Enterobacter cloacae]